jgi:hypothetical protein
VEMVAALAIFSTTAAAFLGVFATCLKGMDAARDRTRAVLLAQGLMEETLSGGVLAAGSSTGDFGEAFPNAVWALNVAETDIDELYEVRVTVGWAERGKDHTFDLVSLGVGNGR